MKIGKHEATIKPIEPKPIQFDKKGKVEVYLSPKGEPLKKIQLQKSEYKWVNEKTGKDHDDKAEKPAKSVNGTPVGTQEKTTETDYEKCEFKDLVKYAKNPKTYLVVSNTLKEELKESKKPITFQYSSGRNYVPYRAIVFYDEDRDILLMRCLEGDMSEVNFKKLEVDDKADKVEIVEKAKPLSIKV